jgi:DNA-binding HxlR family transcriptional regulator
MGTTRFAEYCPIAVGAEFFADRWTPLVMRELIMGATQFNEIHRGIPRISRTLLSQRLRQLQERGLVDKREQGPGRPVRYTLTPAGADMEPIVMALGTWAAKWALREPNEENLDIRWLVWHLHKYVAAEELPAKRTTVQFVLRGPGGGQAWIVLDEQGATACQQDPGYDVDVIMRGDNREAHRWFLGRTTLEAARRAGLLELEGPTKLVRQFPAWFGPHPFKDTVIEHRKEMAGVG